MLENATDNPSMSQHQRRIRRKKKETYLCVQTSANAAARVVAAGGATKRAWPPGRGALKRAGRTAGGVKTGADVRGEGVGGENL